MTGLGTPVALQASLTVWPNSAVQFAKISTKSGGSGKKYHSILKCLQKATLQPACWSEGFKYKKKQGLSELLHAGMLNRCCSSLKSLSHEFLMVTVRACRVYFLTESSRSCQISKARSSPSTVSFTSMLFSCNRLQRITVSLQVDKQREKPET